MSATTLAPVRVMRVIARLNMGGPALHVSYLSAGLVERGYETTLVSGTLARGESSMSFVADNLGVRVVPLAELMPKAIEMANVIASKSPVSIAYAKEATNRALAGDLATNYMVEADLFSILFSTEDAKEGLRAFTEKRKPDFKGR